LTALGEAHAHGVAVDWARLFEGSGARRVELPTYAFQRERYWLPLDRGSGDLSAAGLRAIDHPLLSTGQQLAGTDEWLFTGRVARATHPWVSDHVLLDTVVLPGTAWVELVLAAADAVGCDALEELTFESPLVLGEQDAAQLQVRMEAPDDSGRRPFAIYSRMESPDDGDEQDWTRHASGAVAPAADAAPSELVERLAAESWPPEGAEEVDVDDMYDQLTGLGFAYGGSFMGVRAAWRRPDEIFAEVALEEEHAEEAARYRVHPALFDTAMHAVVAFAADSEDGGARMLFHWQGMRLYAGQVTAMRVRIGLASDESWNMAALDPFGGQVLSVEEVVPRQVEPEQLALARRGRSDDRFRLEWVEVPVPSTNGHPQRFAVLGDLEAPELGERYADVGELSDAIDAESEAPDVVLAPLPVDDGGDAAEAARAGVLRTLALLRSWLGQERLSNARLVLVASGAVAARDGEAPDLRAAAQWGLVRSAQNEHPGRFGILDMDGADASWNAASAVLAGGEAQMAMRDGAVLVPRVARTDAVAAADEPAFDPDGTVLITGGTSGLGALVARHVVEEHGVRHLMLLSRRGPEAPGVGELEAELQELGATPVLAACDVADRDQLSQAFDAIPPEHPLTAVIHAAGVLDDGVVDSLMPDQVEKVMRPKVDGALHLHELTEGVDLAHFVIFSSFAATVGPPGQGNYAAANAFVDALAQRRHASGLPVRSLVYGAWSESGGMTSDRDEADKARIRRLGAALLTNEEGLALFDAALRADDPLPVLVRLDSAILGRMARDGALPPILSGLARARPGRTGEVRDSIQRRLSGVPEADWPEVVLDLVRSQVADVLGLESGEVVDPQLTFKELGFDSLSAVELRNGLMRATGIQLPATTVFDHPTPAAVGEYILGQLPRDGAAAQQAPSFDGEFERIERLLEEAARDEQRRTQIEARLRAFNARVRGYLMDGAESADGDGQEDLDSVSDDEMFALIDKELGAG
ncbi:MAG: type I polyketide synthase, partial [Actinomycetota bacterium]|nr:type I polyketide synthase [Actinomycetota bacterium]